MARITKNMAIGKIVQKYPKTFPIFAKYGMHCIGCVISAYENLEQGAAAHGIKLDAMLKDLNKAIEPNKKTKKTVTKRKGKKKNAR